ncbi:MAG: DUF2946 domain-containing protein [Hyphomicrobium sp.]|uniref:DUF2946 domain-containing protein n=1 Tax=Hyphomicrobium sp. TaxID=82 RepID=UPI0039E63FB0
MFALLGVINFASLLPNHLISELRHFLFVADFGSFADFICESGKSRSEQPDGKTSNCPFCKGLAAFQLAVTSAPPTVGPLVATGQKIDASEAALLAIVFLVRARSRGPPAFV